MKFIHKLSVLFRRKKHEAEMAEELRLHLEQRTRENLAAGLSPEDARYAARRKFGGVEQVKEIAREQRGWIWLEQFLQDLRYAARQLRRSPGFAAVAVLSLALGIGANTAIFSLVDDVLLKMLPVKNPEELVLLRWLSGPGGFDVPVSGSWEKDPATGLTSCTSFSQRIFERFRDDNRTLAAVFAFAPVGEPTLIVGGEAEISSYGAQLVSGGYHAGLGVQALLGRIISDEDDRPGAPPVAVISHGYWQRRFGGDTAVLGRTIMVNNAPATIVGVTPPQFRGALDAGVAPDISLPLAMLPVVDAGLVAAMKRGGQFWWLRVMGRLKPGTAGEQVRGNLGEIFRQMAAEDLAARPSHRPAAGKDEVPQLAVAPGSRGLTDVRHGYVQPLMILMGLVGLVLLIASANVANLLLARGAARRREIATRLALGAGRGRLIRQLLTESGLLVLLGAAGGWLFAFWGKDLLVAMNLLMADGPQSLAFSPSLDWRVLAFTTLVAIGTGLFFGLVPALRATRIDLGAGFQGSGRSLNGGFRSALARTLMVGQVALAVVLLVGAGLFVRTLHNLEGIEVGFNRERLLLFRITAKMPAYDSARWAGLHDEITRRIDAIPGVRVATFSSLPLLSRAGWGTNIRVEGRVTPAGKRDFAMLNAVGPDFFATLGIPVLAGHDFTGREAGQAPVALINETFAKRYFPGENPVGRRFSRSGPKGNMDAEIVGIVRDAKYTEVKGETPPTAYFPFSQESNGEANYAVRTTGDPEAAVSSIRQAVRSIDPNLPLAAIRTQEAQIERLFSNERLFTRFSSFFGGLALVLVCVGLYGLMSYAVTCRTGEIGIRMALGALPRRVLWMVLGESLALAGTGAAIGLGAAALLTRTVEKMLFGVVRFDPATYGAVTLLLMVAALLAAWWPARRAAKVDPMVALRCE